MSKDRSVKMIWGKVVSAAFGLCVVVIASIYAMDVHPAYAVNNTNYNSPVIKKAILTGVYRCYEKDALTPRIDDPTKVTSFNDLIIAHNSPNGVFSNATEAGAAENHKFIALPSGLTGIKDNDIDCKNLFIGDASGVGEGGKFEGVLALAGQKSSDWSSAEEKNNLLKGMGYVQTVTDEKKCARFSFNEDINGRGAHKIFTDKICATIGSDGKISELDTFDDDSASYYLAAQAQNEALQLPKFFSVADDGNKIQMIRTRIAEPGELLKHRTTLLGVGSKWEDFLDDLKQTVSQEDFTFEYTPRGSTKNTIIYSYTREDPIIDSEGRDEYLFIDNSKTKAANQAIKFLSGNEFNDYVQGLAFSNAEMLNLLRLSLQEYFYSGASDYWVCDVDDWSKYGDFPKNYAIHLSADGKVGGDCRLNPNKRNKDNADGSINGFKVDRTMQSVGGQSGGTIYHFDSSGNVKLDFQATINEINRLADLLPKDTIVGTENGEGNSGTPAEDAGTVAACYEGAGALGWIACPVLEAMGAATSWMYDALIEPALEIKASALFSDKKDNGVYGVWSTFRNIANIAFAVVFVVIILAQVTGIGVSNYNIKKILPRLIMVVVLVNLSYIICQLAVDISNVLGSSIKATLTDIPVGGAEQNDLPQMLKVILNGMGLLAAGSAGLVGMMSFSVTAALLKELWLPILIAVLGCLIAIFFFFLLLGVRQAGVVILVVLAPVAIVCYALPNTKTFFDKWKKLFVAMLLVYPICGLMMGGGQLAGAILLSMVDGDETGVFFTITAMLLNVVPFFLIPSILKSSMTVAGNLGAKIANFGSNVRGGLSRGIRNTNAYKEHQEEATRNLNIARNQRRRDRLSTSGKTGGLYGRFRRSVGWNDNLSNRQQALLGRAQSSLDRATDERAAQLRAVMEQNGMAGDIDTLQQEYDAATDALLADPNDYEALERQQATASLLLSSGKGRASLLDSSQKFVNRVGAMSDPAEAGKAMSAMQRSISSLMRSNAGNIAKSPLLSEQFKAMSKPTNLQNQSQYAGINTEAIKESVNSLNARSVSEMKKQDLKTYIDALKNNDIRYGDKEFDRITSLASRAMTDQHYKGNIEADSMPYMQQLANMRYVPPTGSGATSEQVDRAVANADNEELNRVQSYLQDSSVDQSEKDAMLDNLSHTLGRSLSQAGDSGVSSDDASFNVRAATAQQIGSILEQNGRHIGDLGRANGYGYDTNAAQDRYDIATGMAIDHSNYRTLSQRHPDWQRANSADANGAYSKDDWIQVSKNSTGQITRIRRLNAQETKEAEMLEERDIAQRLTQQDASNAAKQRWGRP